MNSIELQQRSVRELSSTATFGLMLSKFVKDAYIFKPAMDIVDPIGRLFPYGANSEVNELFDAINLYRHRQYTGLKYPL